jgi:hypothetical protein
VRKQLLILNQHDVGRLRKRIRKGEQRPVGLPRTSVKN